ncbi:MAG: mechanosensitive ion channel domain-containing protein [Planctomycetaceae bacterium]
MRRVIPFAFILLFVVVTPDTARAQSRRGFLSRRPVPQLFRGSPRLLVPHRAKGSLFNVTDFWNPQQEDDWQPVESAAMELQPIEATIDPLVVPAPITFDDTISVITVSNQQPVEPTTTEPMKDANTAVTTPKVDATLFESGPATLFDDSEQTAPQPAPATDSELPDPFDEDLWADPDPEQSSEPTEPTTPTRAKDEQAPTEPTADTKVTAEVVQAAEPNSEPNPNTQEAPAKPTPAAGQATMPEPPAQTVVRGLITEDVIHSRIEELESLPQSSTTVVEIDLYKQALTWIQAARTAKAEARRVTDEAQSIPEQLFDATAELASIKTAGDKPIDTKGAKVEQIEAALVTAKNRIHDLETQQDVIATDLETVARRMQDPVSFRNELLASIRSAERLALDTENQSTSATVEANARVQMLKTQLALATVYAQNDANLSRLLKARQTLLDARLTNTRKRIEQLQSAADSVRKHQAAEKAARAKAIAEQVPTEFKPFADQNTTLAEHLKWINDRIGTTQQQTTEAEAIYARLSRSFDRVRKTQERTGLNTTLGLILNHELENLPGTRLWQRRISGIEDQLHELSEVEFAVEQFQRDQQEAVQELQRLSNGLAAANPNRTESIRQIGGGLAKARGDLIKNVQESAQTYSETLTTFDAKSEELVELIHSFESHINKNVLWIRSNDPLSVSDFAAFGTVAGKLSSSTDWIETADSILSAIRESLWLIALAGLLVLVLMSFGDEIRGRLKRTGERRKRDNRVYLRPTLEAIFLTCILGFAWPVFFWTLGWSISGSLGSTDIALAIGYALQTAAMWFGAFSIPRAMCLPDGLGHRHFAWPEAALKMVYRGLPAIMTWGLPVVAVVAFFSSYDQARWSGNVGRIAFISGAIILAFLTRRALNTEDGFVVQWSRGTGWLHRSRHAIAMFGVGMPIALAITSACGYHHSSLQLSRCLQESWMLAIGLAVLLGLGMRCIECVMQSFEEGKPVVAFPFRARVLHPNSVEASAATQAIELAANRDQVQRFLRFGTVLAGVLCCWGIWNDVLPALNVVNDIQLWSATKETTIAATANSVAQTVRQSVPVTLGDLIRAIMVCVVTIVAARNLPGLLDTFVLRRLPFDRGGRHAISTICRYVLTTVGMLFTLKQIGIDWASLQWMVAAMTVGLGFGLQEIFANFVSGLIILLERPIRLGDFVTVNGETGFVTRIQFRATTITDLDRRELLVPNKKFITDELINWTLSDPITRLVLPVGIAYGSDTTLTHKLLVEVAEEHPIVLKEPEPSAVMTAFGDSTLNFELRVFIPRRDEFAQILHELNTAIDRKFRAANIEIAFPQCDINVRGLEQLTAMAARRAA